MSILADCLRLLKQMYRYIKNMYCIEDSSYMPYETQENNIINLKKNSLPNLTTFLIHPFDMKIVYFTMRKSFEKD